MEENEPTRGTTMITTDMALYAPTTSSDMVDDRPLVCGCGQELSGVRRAHCPRCGCCLN